MDAKILMTVDKKEALQHLFSTYPNAKFIHKIDPLQEKALMIFLEDWTNIDKIKLHLKGTPFQLKVWESLLRIPFGGLQTYSSIAKEINRPKAVRAVGTAIGKNPIAYLIPCQRVIKSTGMVGEYQWGSNRKTSIIGWEAARLNA